MAAAEIFIVYEAILWHRGRTVRARLHYLQSWERCYQVSRLVQIEELPDEVEYPAAA